MALSARDLTPLEPLWMVAGIDSDDSRWRSVEPLL